MSGARQKGQVRAALAGARHVAPTPPEAEAFLPPHCPVVPLGKFSTNFYYLDAKRQLVELPGREHSRLGILTLFDHAKDFLYQHFPRHDKEGTVTGWRPERVAEALMATCGVRGIWNPSDRERGRGAWLGEHGELILHTGQQVVTFAPNPRSWGDRIVREAGVIGRHVYPADEDVGAPAGGPEADPGAAARDLLEQLRTWKWRRPEIDPILLLGWIGAGMIGGALDWRAIVWITGGRGTGKSTLHELLHGVFDGTLIKLADTSEAYIRQRLKHQTLPVLLDESESEEDNRKLNGIVKLARIAASGGKIGRGGADHNAVEFTMRSAFMFGSILLPPLLGQDRSRISILELGELASGTARVDATRARWAACGMQLRRRMVDGWGRWRTTLDWYREALAGVGHSRRGQDQLGTLLAAADLLLFDGDANAATGGEWIAELRAADLAEIEDDERDEDRCIKHLLFISVDPFRNGSRRTLAEWVRIAAAWAGQEDERDQAAKVLQTYGLKVQGRAEKAVLLIANYHPQLGELFRETHWAGRSGSMGVWVQAMRRLPGAERAGAVYFAGPTSRATSVPLLSVLPRTDPDAPRSLV